MEFSYDNRTGVQCALLLLTFCRNETNPVNLTGAQITLAVQQRVLSYHIVPVKCPTRTVQLYRPARYLFHPYSPSTHASRLNCPTCTVLVHKPRALTVPRVQS